MLAVLFLATSTAQRGYDRTGFDGDFFSLEGAIDVFKKSNSINDFERRLNTRDAWVNNLDLNHDGQTDYIRVEHKMRGDYHAIILQVPISRREVQDIAVIEIEKTGRRRAMLQIVGDEYLYGEQVIVEPYEGQGYADGRGGPNADFTFTRGYVNVYYWPSVRHILRRGYNPWISPYRYSYYPTWWSPWRQSPWDNYYPNVIVYNRYYQIVYVHRLRNVYNFYRPYRVYCPSVYQRSNIVRTNRTNNRLSPSYSKARKKQRAQINQNVAGGKRGKNNVTGRTRTTAKANTPQRASTSTTRTNSRANSRVENRSSAPNTRSQSRSTTKTTNSRSNSTYGSRSSTPTSRSNTRGSRSTTKTSRSNSRAKVSTPSRSSRATSSAPRKRSTSSRATSRSNSRKSSSATRSSRSSRKSSSRVSSKRKN